MPTFLSTRAFAVSSVSSFAAAIHSLVLSGSWATPRASSALALSGVWGAQQETVMRS